MKLTKYVRAVLPLFILFASAVVYLQLAAMEVGHSSQTHATYMELACYFLIMLGLMALCSELMMRLKRQRMRLIYAITIPIVFAAVVFLLNNYLVKLRLTPFFNWLQ